MERTLRFNGLPWYQPVQSKHVLIVGAGGIGSWTALLLSRVFEETNITVMDFDIVDGYNMGGQLYSQNQIDSFKTGALAKTINMNYGGYIATSNSRVEDFQLLATHHTIIVAVDNMKARKHIYESVKRIYDNSDFLINIIDGRLLAESYQIFTVNTPERLREYKLTLFDDSEVPDLACSAKATSHCGASIAADITGLFLNIVTNEDAGDDIRDVPYMLSKHFDLMMYDTEVPKMFQA